MRLAIPSREVLNSCLGASDSEVRNQVLFGIFIQEETSCTLAHTNISSPYQHFVYRGVTLMQCAYCMNSKLVLHPLLAALCSTITCVAQKVL